MSIKKRDRERERREGEKKRDCVCVYVRVLRGGGNGLCGAEGGLSQAGEL